MIPRKLQPGLGSAVARRVFVLFLVSALLPVGVLGVFAWIRSAQELERAARAQLHEDAKREGMAMLSRLLVAEASLADAGDRAPRLAARDEGATGRPFASVRTLQAREAPGGPPTDEERAALQRGASVLRATREAGVFLLHAPDGEPGAERLRVGEVAPGYLWTFDRNDAAAALTVVDAAGNLLFSSLDDAGADAVARATARGVAEVEAGDQIAEAWLLFVSGDFAPTSWRIVRSQPYDVTIAALAHFRRVFGWSALLALCVVGALSSIQLRRTLGPIARLVSVSQRLGEGDLTARAQIGSHDEFGALGQAFDAMAARIQRSVHSLESASELGRALGSQQSEQALGALLLRALLDATHARSAALVRITPDAGLVVEGMLGAWGGLTPAVYEAQREGRETQRWGEAPELVLPVRDHHETVVALLQVTGARGDDGTPLTRFREADVAVARSLATQASIAFANRALVHEFRTLFEGLIELTIAALDAKSAYTAGHCRRVPILAEMLTEAVCATREGTFAGFSFSSAQRYELRIAALLHDFGKIVTPVHVMDKAAKLETIHDRIELVATRYAVLERDAEVAWLRERLASAGTPAGEWPGLPELAEELAFLRAQNRGGESQAEAVRERIVAIAEARRWRALGGASLPVLTADELENLTIARGTLTAAERKVIEDHADQTIHLLSQLPFPPHLRAVPAIAGSHHERVCGGGYPLGLRGEEITLQGRILGLADVFEALTAPDRPYREPLSVSAALGLIDDMVKRGFLDADVFEVFVREGVHLRYAREQLRPEQLDDATLEALARLPGGPLPPA